VPGISLSDIDVLAFVLIPITLAVAFIVAIWYAWSRSSTTPAAARAAAVATVVTTAWMAVTWMAAGRGTLRNWESTPPAFALLVVTILLLAFRIGAGDSGRRIAESIPLWALVVVQAFRLPLELAMHRMYERGIMPVQMSYSGLNYDILTGASALVVAALVYTNRASVRIVRLWNVIGCLLLINVVTVAILATPRIRYFGDEHLNTWVTYPPFVWLPAVMVLAALAGHLIVFRAIRDRRG
jgi:hypothetical protein